LNVLVMNNGKSYTNQQTGQKMGVSFVVMVLRQLDRPISTWRGRLGRCDDGGGSAGSSSSSAGRSSTGIINPQVSWRFLFAPAIRRPAIPHADELRRQHRDAGLDGFGSDAARLG